MWTPSTRRQHSREGLRYETDLTDSEWALIEPLMPKPLARGRPREWPLREVMNAIFYVLRGGVAWRLLPTDLPPRDGVPMVQRMAGHRSVRGHESSPCHGGPRAGWTRGIA